MTANRGSLSLILLVALLYITVFAQIVLYHVHGDYERTLSYAQGIQQRVLCSSVLEWVLKQPAPVENFQFQQTLAPGNQKVTVTHNRITSDDNMFESISVKVSGKQKELALNRLGFYPSQELRTLAEQFMFISKYTPTGTNYLSSGSLYTSGGSFTMPAINFLANIAHKDFDMTTLHENGFTNKIYYLSQEATLTYLTTAKTTKGSALLAGKSGITIQKDFKATDHLIIIANGSVTLKDNVTLNKALIIAKGNVVLGKGCKINGVIFSNSTIKLQGSGTYTHDASVVADYASAIFIV